MNIVIVHQYYLMQGQAGGSRFNEFARLWSAAGHDVTVIAGNLDYLTGEVPERYRGHWIVREDDGPVRVLRCWVPPSYSKGYVGRAFAYFGFTLSACTAALGIARPDVVIASSPPLTAAIPGWVTARLRRRPVSWVFEMRDLWPESAITSGVIAAGSPLTKVLYGLERWASRSANRVNVLTPAFRDDLLKRQLVEDDRIAFIPNGADVELFSPGPRDNHVRRELGWGDRCVFLYAGAHGRANALHQLLDAAATLRDRPDILIACVGDGPERAGLEAKRRERGLDNLAFLGSKPKTSMPDFVNACDVGLAVLADNPTMRLVYPNKVFDYMACERPALLAIDGVARKLVCDEAQAGAFAQPEDGTALGAAMRTMADDPTGRAAMGRRGRAWVLANATRESLAARYIEVLRGVVSEGAPAAR